MILPILFSLLPQQATPQAPVAEDSRLGLYPSGIEAPAQPTGRSRSRVTTGARPAVRTAAGATGRVRVRIGDLAIVQGQEYNVVQGIGLVTGLAGTGDSSNAARLAILNMLRTQHLNLQLQDISSANVAMVLVQANLEPGIQPGIPTDVRVSSINDCKSLVGGVLLHCELTTMSGLDVWATASGPITTGAFSAEGDGASATRNHLTVGTIPRGGKVQRPVPTELVNQHGYIYLNLRALKGSFANTARMAAAINELYPQAAVAKSAMQVAVRVPDDLPREDHVSYLASILSRELVPEAFARVVINERTGVIVMGEGVRITRGAITKGNLTVTIAETPEASQPAAFSDGETEVLPRTSLLLEEEDRGLTIVNGAVTMQEVVEVLNVLGVTPRDMIQILQSMAQSGMLHAEIVVM